MPNTVTLTAATASDITNIINEINGDTSGQAYVINVTTTAAISALTANLGSFDPTHDATVVFNESGQPNQVHTYTVTDPSSGFDYPDYAADAAPYSTPAMGQTNIVTINSNTIWGGQTLTYTGAAPTVHVLEADTAQQLATDLNTYNASSGGRYVIALGANITLTGDLPVISGGGTLTIDGEGHTLSGGDAYRGFLVYNGTATINDLTISHTAAIGGDGGSGFASGGGGAGLGGGLFVGAAASVTLSDVHFANDSAVGGNAGQITTPDAGYNISGGGGGGGGTALTSMQGETLSSGGGGGGIGGAEAASYDFGNVDGGTGNDYLDGGTGNDNLIGGAGNDTLMGMGAETMHGGAGDDTYYVNNAQTVVSEETTPGIDDGGHDLVYASITYPLPDFVEDLTLQGSANLNGTGNDLANIIHGNAGDNVITGMDGDDILLGGGGNDTLIGGTGNDYLDGGPGNDVLTGGDGADRFAFEYAGSANGFDTVTDYVHGTDSLWFNGADYGVAVGGTLSADMFTVGTQAVGAHAQFIWDAANHTLYWDDDGTGSDAAVAIATFTGVTTLDTTDFHFK